MRWYLDTHKFMSEITRKALQIISNRGITSNSKPEEIENAERELAKAGVYRNFESAKGRIRRALFTYFKAYSCLDDNERLTEMGRLFVDEEITVQEMCFHYILNYRFSDKEISYYPLQLILRTLRMLYETDEGQAFISAYDFSRIEECNSVEEIDESFIKEIINARRGEPVEVNERGVGYDVWSNILVSAGIMKKTSDRTLIIKDDVLAQWISSTYEYHLNYFKGKILTGPFEFLPLPPLTNPKGNAEPFMNNGKALQAYLFEDIDDRIIAKYIYQPSDSFKFGEMLKSIGIDELSKSFYKHFVGLEKLVGYCLVGNKNHNVRVVGSILASVKLTEEELTQVMPVQETFDYDKSDRLPGGTNTIIYGVPGSGKSWTIKQEYCDDNSSVERLVFHPDYTNADFLGQILPVVDEDRQVTYEFTAGPFTVILRDAYRNPLRKYVLIIEEINRGNAPAIFGEVFQLLDRKIEKQDGDDGYPVGTSEYGITHKYMAEYIYGDSKHKVRIPSNLTIVGTMNTSDQNVFTLDTAFQRRWRMRLVENSFKNVRYSLKYAEILDTNVTWMQFCETINEIIIGNRSKMASAEDKRLGVYFVHETELLFDEKIKPSNGYETLFNEQEALVKYELMGQLTPERKERLTEIRKATMNIREFPEKVIKYLWDDAFKFNPEALFDTDNMLSLEQVIRTFINSTGEDRFRIFKPTVRSALYPSAGQ